MPETGTGFSNALRDHVLRRGTIAQACKATGINRQQFNKYLAGDVLPGTRTLRKICSYLGVSEALLMAGQRPGASGGSIADDPEIDFGRSSSDLSAMLADVLRTMPANPGMLRNGFYRAHFPVRDQASLVARWTIQIAAGPQGSQVCSGRNRFQDGPALGYPANRICYRGPVAYGPREAALIGTAHAPLPVHAIISVDLRPVVGSDYFSAIVLTRRPEGPIALSGVMQFLGADCSPRCALSGMGVVRLDDPAIDPVVANLMRAVPAAGATGLQLRTEKNLRDGAGGSNLPEALAIPRLAV